MSRLGKGKPLGGQAREVVYNVYNYFMKMKGEINCNVYNSTSEATGVSVRLIHNIIKETQGTSEATRQLFSTPSGKHNKRRKRIHVDDFTKCVIKRKIHDMYAVQKIVPTLSILQTQLKQENILDCSIGFLYKLVKNIGFKWKRCQSERKVLIERPDIVAARIKYLREISKYRTENRPIVYIDETYLQASHSVSNCWQNEMERGVLSKIGKGNRLIIVHGGGEMGFISDALLIFKSTSSTGDYHTSMNYENFSKWLQQKLIPNLPQNSVVVMDNAKYHCVQKNKKPTSSTSKRLTMEWLKQYNVDVDLTMTKAEMLEKVLQIPWKHNYVIDEILIESGNTPLHLPPYHPDLNPIELVWGDIKGEMSRNNIGSNLKEKQAQCEQLFEKYSTEKWVNCCKHVITIENVYKINDCIIDNEIDRLLINLEDSSSNESICSDSDTSYDSV